MKYWKAAILFTIAFLIQASLLNLVSIGGVTPNLLLCLVVVFSFLYEDDRETIAYQEGKNSIIPYSAFYDKESNSFIVRLESANGEFDGKYYSPKKHMKLKVHMLYQDEVEKVLFNGSEVPFSFFKRNMKSKVISNENTSIDSDTVVVEFDYDSKEKAEIEICLLKK